MVCHQIRLHGDDSFSYWLKKKAEDIFCPRMWAWIFRVKRCTVGMQQNKIIRRCFIRKGKSSIATMNLLAQIICFDLIIFFKFLIMQVVLLNILLGER